MNTRRPSPSLAATRAVDTWLASTPVHYRAALEMAHAEALLTAFGGRPLVGLATLLKRYVLAQSDAPRVHLRDVAWSELAAYVAGAAREEANLARLISETPENVENAFLANKG